MELIKSIPFYHGTDARMIEMTETDRQQYLDDCNDVINYLSQFYLPLLEMELTDEEYEGKQIKFHRPLFEIRYRKVFEERNALNLYINIKEKLHMLESRNNNSGLYQYGSFYLTTNKMTALNYAQRSFAGGEIGLMAYRLIEGTEIINFTDYNPDESLKNKINRIKEFGEEGKEHPVIVSFDNVDFNCLSYENGNPLKIKEGIPELIGSHFRFNKPEELKWDVIEKVDKNLIAQIYGISL